MRTVRAIGTLDPTGRKSLAVYLKALTAAEAHGDDDEVAYVLDAIKELFVPDGDGGTLEDWQKEVESIPEGKRAAEECRQAEGRFFNVYHHLKQESGLTVRELAAASGLSPTTIVAIEKQRVKPHRRTMKALANAFNVSVEEISGRVPLPAKK